MRKFWPVLFSLILAVILVGAGGCIPAKTDSGPLPSISGFVETIDAGKHLGLICSQQNVGLWVTGEGKALATPDTALLRLGIEAEADSVNKAQKKASEAMDKVMKVLRSNGISEKDIQTQRFNIYAVRRWFEEGNREEIIGYRVTNTVVARIRKIDEAGTVIDAVAEAGGNLTRIENITFTVENPTPYYKEARENAVRDATIKAKHLAELADIDLGKPIYISEGTAYSPPARDFYKGEAISAVPPTTPISPGELEFRLTVQMVYEFD